MFKNVCITATMGYFRQRSEYSNVRRVHLKIYNLSKLVIENCVLRHLYFIIFYYTYHPNLELKKIV